MYMSACLLTGYRIQCDLQAIRWWCVLGGSCIDVCLLSLDAACVKLQIRVEVISRVIFHEFHCTKKSLNISDRIL